MSESQPYRVAVIGAGPQGLCMLKNLLDLNTPEKQIFDAEILEARDGLGGIWNFTSDPDILSTLPSTLSNVTRFRNCYADFPVREAWEMAKARGDKRASEEEMVRVNGAVLKEGRKDPGSVDGIPIFLSAAQQQMYFEMYAEKFRLRPHIKFHQRVAKVSKDQKSGKWIVEVRDTTSNGGVRKEVYDKVVIASGQHETPDIPDIEGMNGFKGEAIHVMRFKDPAAFKGKKVMVIGFGSTAADTATALVGHAEKVYLSHRSGGNVLPRVINHMPLDVGVKRRLTQRSNIIGSFSPLKPVRDFHNLVTFMTQLVYGDRLKPEWGFSPAPTPSSYALMISDHIVECMEAGEVEACDMLLRILEDGQTAELRDGKKVSIDAVIFATGYLTNSLIDLPIEYTGSPALPRMYQNIFLPSDPTSFAAQTLWATPTGICEVADLMAMAIAQVFAGNYTLPPRWKLEREIDIWHTRTRDLQALGFLQGDPRKISRTVVTTEAGWRAFMHDAAGTQFNEMLGWGPQGLAFWARDPDFSYMLMMGVDNPSVYRLWPSRKGGRKTWDGARRAIEEANKEAEAYMAESRAREEAEKASKERLKQDIPQAAAMS